MKKLEDWLTEEQPIDELLFILDTVAMEYDRNLFGLPLACNTQRRLLRLEVVAWLSHHGAFQKGILQEDQDELVTKEFDEQLLDRLETTINSTGCFLSAFWFVLGLMLGVIGTIVWSLI